MMDKKRLALDESTLPKNWVVATLKEVTQYIHHAANGPTGNQRKDIHF